LTALQIYRQVDLSPLAVKAIHRNVLYLQIAGAVVSASEPVWGMTGSVSVGQTIWGLTSRGLSMSYDLMTITH